jgi:hypothetical protein
VSGYVEPSGYGCSRCGNDLAPVGADGLCTFCAAGGSGARVPPTRIIPRERPLGAGRAASAVRAAPLKREPARLLRPSQGLVEGIDRDVDDLLGPEPPPGSRPGARAGG